MPLPYWSQNRASTLWNPLSQSMSSAHEESIRTDPRISGRIPTDHATRAASHPAAGHNVHTAAAICSSLSPRQGGGATAAAASDQPPLPAPRTRHPAQRVARQQPPPSPPIRRRLMRRPTRSRAVTTPECLTIAPEAHRWGKPPGSAPLTPPGGKVRVNSPLGRRPPRKADPGVPASRRVAGGCTPPCFSQTSAVRLVRYSP